MSTAGELSVCCSRGTILVLELSTDNAPDELYQALKNSEGGNSLRQFLALPIDVLTRERREEMMATELLPGIMGQEHAEPDTLKVITGAMIKVMAKPTFYQVSLIHEPCNAPDHH